MIRFKFDVEAVRVESVECEKCGYPNYDADGAQQFENTHFDTFGEAYARLLEELRAGLWLALRERRDARTRYDRATAAVADGVERLARARALDETLEEIDTL